MKPGTPTLDESARAATLAVADLLTRLRTDFAFVGSVAKSAWFGSAVDGGPIDVLVALSPEGRHQVPMMASNRGFVIDREALDASQLLDLVPLRWPFGGDEVRIHVLIASNALYGTMIRDAAAVTIDELTVKVVAAEGLALLLMLSEDYESQALLERLVATEGFDLEGFNRTLESIGLRKRVIPR